MTWTKFFAAARSIAGPPTSIISTASSSRTFRCEATLANGYRLMQTRSNGSIPCSLERRLILGNVAPGEDGGVNRGMERLHPPAEELGELRQLLHPGDDEPEALDVLRRTAARDELCAELDEPGHERVEARLVVDGEECPAHHRS